VRNPRRAAHPRGRSPDARLIPLLAGRCLAPRHESAELRQAIPARLPRIATVGQNAAAPAAAGSRHHANPRPVRNSAPLADNLTRLQSENVITAGVVIIVVGAPAPTDAVQHSDQPAEPSQAARLSLEAYVQTEQGLFSKTE